jgi:hypothetical protein
MNSRLSCKVGDLAIIVRAEQSSNVGQIVEVMGPQSGNPFKLYGRGHVWQVRTVSQRATLTYRYRDGLVVRYSAGPAPDQCLRPVSGLADSDSVKEDIGIAASTSKRKCRALSDRGLVALQP